MKTTGSYLSGEEQGRRHQALQKLMSESECGACIVVGSPQFGGKRYFRYFTDWDLQSIGGYALFRRDLPPAVVFRASSQAYWAQTVGWIDEIISNQDPLKVVLERIGECGRGREVVGVVGLEYMSFTDYSRLERSGRPIQDITAQVDSVMSAKSEEEQVLLKDTAAIFDAAWLGVVQEIKPGVTEWEAAAIAQRLLAAAGVSHSVILIGASSEGAPARCVGWPRPRKIGTRDLVQMSIEGSGPSGYCIEVGGTFSFEQPDDSIKAQLQTQIDGMEAGRERMTPGTPAGEVATAIDDVFRGAGYTTGYWAGHGIGLGVPEPPMLEKENEERLQQGMAVALHPNAVSPDDRGTLLSRTYLVTEEGGLPISRLPLQWDEIQP